MMRAQEQLAKDFDDWFTTRLKQLQIAQQQQQRITKAAAPPNTLPIQAFEFGGATSKSARAPSYGNALLDSNSKTSTYSSVPAPSAYGSNHPSSAPSGSGSMGLTSGPTGTSRLAAASTSYAGGGGAAFRHPSPPPTTMNNSYSQPPASSSMYNRTPSTNYNAPSTASSATFARSTSGATFTEAQHLETLSQHKAHNTQMQTIVNTSTNSTAASYGTASGGNAQAMNPYCPQYPSTGDAAADAQLAAMYKARDEMRAKLQQQQGR
eukprot:GDKK01024983.1.p1 GENE.GDKK01024983.1~~GDKK01024983.1.p1  ORF type:complete len:265 (+),score=28.04 GDKK01024983.1:2-796(+)